MHVHVALFKWRDGTEDGRVEAILRDVEALEQRVPGIVEISCGENTSKYRDGYSHVVLVRGESRAAIDAYLRHPDHVAVSARIDEIQDSLVAVDLVTRN
jgi:heme-degrading monooxygenase HmoA